MDSYYAMLSVTKESTTEELTKSYRKLSLKVHPDKRGGSEEAFQKLNRAYEVLKDEKSLSDYITEDGQTLQVVKQPPATTTPIAEEPSDHVPNTSVTVGMVEVSTALLLART